MTKAHTYSEEVADMDIHSVLATLPYSIKAYVVANPDMSRARADIVVPVQFTKYDRIEVYK